MDRNRSCPDYRPSWYFRNGHVSTVFAGVFRPPMTLPAVVRKRLETPDGDFLDLDVSSVGGSRLLVLLHGLEGHSRRPYMAGMQRLFQMNGWDTLALNFRGCSGEPNRLLRSYHSGETDDLRTVLQWVKDSDSYEQVSLIGFSLGGNVVLKFLAEEADKADPQLGPSAVFSVPCDLASSSARLDSGLSRWYGKRFLKTLIPKGLEKASRFPGTVDVGVLSRASSLRDFDDAFIAPVHGFKDAGDYYERSSSINLLDRIGVPVLMVQAEDDPFLTPSCFPKDTGAVLVQKAPFGGHVGFPGSDGRGFYWSENRALQFCEGRG